MNHRVRQKRRPGRKPEARSCILVYREGGEQCLRIELPGRQTRGRWLVFGSVMICFALTLCAGGLLLHTDYAYAPDTDFEASMQSTGAAGELHRQDARAFLKEFVSMQQTLSVLHVRQQQINERLFARDHAASSLTFEDDQLSDSPSGRRAVFEGGMEDLGNALAEHRSYVLVYALHVRTVPHRWPVFTARRTVNSGFGYRRNPFGFTGGDSSQKFHRGVDLKGRRGDPVVASGEGLVSHVQHSSRGYGNLVRVQHPSGYESYYAHLDSIAVQTGVLVKPGDRIGTVGSTGHSTGPHLHYEIRRGGKAIDPDEFLDR